MSDKQGPEAWASIIWSKAGDKTSSNKKKQTKAGPYSLS